MLDLSWEKLVVLVLFINDPSSVFYCFEWYILSGILVRFLCIYCWVDAGLLCHGTFFPFYICVGLCNTIPQVFEGRSSCGLCRVLGCFEFATLWIGYEYIRYMVNFSSCLDGSDCCVLMVMYSTHVVPVDMLIKYTLISHQLL